MTIEEAAAFAHERWCNWMHWMDAHWNDTHALGELFLERRYRQAETLYEQLSDAEKDSDRQEAAAWMNVLEVGQLRAEVARLRDEARWIPVGERVPEDYTLVLVAAPHVDEHIRLADHVPSCRSGCAFWRSRVNGTAITVTHWRELPSPPEVHP